MKELIKNKWIIIFTVLVVGVFYMAGEAPKTLDEDANEPLININA